MKKHCDWRAVVQGQGQLYLTVVRAVVARLNYDGEMRNWLGRRGCEPSHDGCGHATLNWLRGPIGDGPQATYFFNEDAAVDVSEEGCRLSVLEASEGICEIPKERSEAAGTGRIRARY
jgi:hypothetical protein